MKLKAKSVSRDDEGKGVWWAPDIQDNREKDDDSICELRIDQATQKDVDRIRRAAMKKGLSTKTEEEIQFEASKMLFLERITGMRGPWTFEDEEGETSSIDSVEELLEVLLQRMPAINGREYFNQICLAITDGSRMEEGARKNLSSRYGSS